MQARGSRDGRAGAGRRHELPESAELLTHRVGRTGRMGREGRAVTLLQPEDLDKWRQMERTLGRRIRRIRREAWRGTVVADAPPPRASMPAGTGSRERGMPAREQAVSREQGTVSREQAVAREHDMSSRRGTESRDRGTAPREQAGPRDERTSARPHVAQAASDARQASPQQSHSARPSTPSRLWERVPSDQERRRAQASRARTRSIRNRDFPSHGRVTGSGPANWPVAGW